MYAHDPLSTCPQAVHSIARRCLAMCDAVRVVSHWFDCTCAQTFRPKKRFEQGTMRYNLHKQANASLSAGIDLREAVKLPPSEELNDWIAVHGTSLHTPFTHSFFSLPFFSTTVPIYLPIMHSLYLSHFLRAPSYWKTFLSGTIILENISIFSHGLIFYFLMEVFSLYKFPKNSLKPTTYLIKHFKHTI